MPVYEYECPGCEHRFEVLAPSTRHPARTACPQCGRQNAQRVISVFSAHSAAQPDVRAPGGCQRCGDPDGPCGLG